MCADSFFQLLFFTFDFHFHRAASQVHLRRGSLRPGHEEECAEVLPLREIKCAFCLEVFNEDSPKVHACFAEGCVRGEDEGQLEGWPKFNLSPPWRGGWKIPVGG